MYAIVDIETTGGSQAENRIIEIAIRQHDEEKVTGRYETLINPGFGIPRFISSLTGIQNHMVQDAPAFEEVAHEIEEFTRDRIFVAHNVNFDYLFLRREFALLKQDFTRKRLCTIRLARKILPGMDSYSLGKLCRQVNLPLFDAHRAGGDAEATAHLFSMLVNEDKHGYIAESVKKNSGELILPPFMDRKGFDHLPKNAGIYFFKDQKGKIIYVGKAKNLKQRVASHFALGSETRVKKDFIQEIHHVDHILTGSEILAALLEEDYIKRLWPAYNAAQKDVSARYALLEYKDQQGYMRLGLSRKKKNLQGLMYFGSLPEARDFLANLIKVHHLCEHKGGFSVLADGPCFAFNQGSCKGVCQGKEKPGAYNKRHKKAVSKLKAEENTRFVIIDRGRNPGESVCIHLDPSGKCGYRILGKRFDNVEAEDILPPEHFLSSPEIFRMGIRYLLNEENRIKIFAVENSLETIEDKGVIVPFPADSLFGQAV